jgi:hypothetical protein
MMKLLPDGPILTSLALIFAASQCGGTIGGGCLRVLGYDKLPLQLIFYSSNQSFIKCWPSVEIDPVFKDLESPFYTQSSSQKIGILS